MAETTKEQRAAIRRYWDAHKHLKAADLPDIVVAIPSLLADAECLAEVEVALQEEKQRLLDDADIDDGTAVAGAKRMAACRLQRILDDGGERNE